jgi:gamma-glutamyltranspeptidase / glutathione hydrolase
MVCAIDPLAVDTALSVLAESGNAVDAAIAANAVLGVTSPNACGVGGDLLAMIAMPEAAPEAMISAGHAGSGASAAELRAEGRTRMPSQGDIRSVTVPGCVDGWFALHARFGTAPLSRLLAPAIEIARDGFPATPSFTAAWGEMADMISGSDVEAPAGLVPGGIVRRPQLARTLEAIAAHGRSGFYEGDAGKRLIELGKGLFNGEDLARSTAHFVAPLSLRAWDHTVWTVPAPSQGYVTLVAANIAASLDLPIDSSDGSWAHLLIESARQAAHDRPETLSERSPAATLLSPARLARRSLIDPDRSSSIGSFSRAGDTTAVCVVDERRCGISLVQSNAAGFGSHLVLPGTGVFLHNRGIGFSLERGHANELMPGRRPAHTLCPTIVTGSGGRLAGVLGTMGGDSQPLILLQLLARWLHNGEMPGDAVEAPRWVLGPQQVSYDGFNTWTSRGATDVFLEKGVPERWIDGLRLRGHAIVDSEATPTFGHAQMIVVEASRLAGASDPRTQVGMAAGR